MGVVYDSSKGLKHGALAIKRGSTSPFGLSELSFTRVCGEVIAQRDPRQSAFRPSMIRRPQRLRIIDACYGYVNRLGQVGAPISQRSSASATEVPDHFPR